MRGASATFSAVVPKLAEGFFEDIGCMQTPVGLKQLFQGAFHPGSGSLIVRAGHNADSEVTPVLATERFVFTMLNFIKGL